MGVLISGFCVYEDRGCMKGVDPEARTSCLPLEQSRNLQCIWLWKAPLPLTVPNQAWPVHLFRRMDKVGAQEVHYCTYYSEEL